MNDKDSLILVKEHFSTKRYGVAFIKDNKLVRAIEKPSVNDINKIILGAYFLSTEFFDVFENIKPSQRNEYEITDVLNELVPNVYCAEYKDIWYDLGTQDDILHCSRHIMNKKKGETK